MTITSTAPAKSTRSRKSSIVPPVPAGAPALQASVLQEHLKRGLAKALPAVAVKSAMPILGHVLLVAEHNHLTISATNLEIGVVATVAAKVAHPGAITLPAKLLSDVVGSLPNETIALALDPRAQSVTLTCGAFEATIKGIAAEEFPIIPAIAGRPPLATFAPEALCSAVGQVAFAAASDDTRPLLTGMRLKLTGTLASFAAADTFRIAFRSITLETAVATPAEVVVPARAMLTLGKLLADIDGTVELLVNDNYVIFRADQVELIARCIDGAYPAIDRYLNLASSTVVELGTKELARAVKLASFFAATSANTVRLQLNPAVGDTGQLVISANAAEVGQNSSAHDIAIRGAGGAVALNVTFLADAIDAICTPTIAIHYNTPQQPIVLKGVGDETYTHVAMPMTMR
jgi:DNA polymerase-3 subunit beta